MSMMFVMSLKLASTDRFHFSVLPVTQHSGCLGIFSRTLTWKLEVSGRH